MSSESNAANGSHKAKKGDTPGNKKQNANPKESKEKLDDLKKDLEMVNYNFNP